MKTASHGARRQPGRALPDPAGMVPLAWRPVFGIAASTAALLFAFAGRHGYDGDELYFVIAGRHLDWGYADQPPGVPVLALLADTLAPGSLRALRLPAIAATAAGIVLAALLAREMGADRRAQWLTAAAYALAFGALGRLLSTMVFDLTLWTLLSWLLARWVRSRREGVPRDRLLLAAGAVVGVAFQVKFQIAVYCAALLTAVLLCGPRSLLTRPSLWAGAALAALSAVPTLLWQHRHGWPQWEMGGAIAAEVSRIDGTAENLALMVLGLGPVLGLVLGAYGLARLLAGREPSDCRFLAVAALLVTGFVVLTGGRAYYVYGVFPALWAAGAAGFQRRRAGLPGRWVGPVIAVSVLWPLADLPLLPRDAYADRPPHRFDKRAEIGWPELADQVGEVYHRLPPGVRDRTVVMSDDYWVASALAYFGPARGLPAVHSGSRGYWFFGAPDADRTTVIYVGDPEPAVRAHFGVVRQVATVDNGLGIDTDYQGRPISLITGQQQPWPRIWPQLRRLNLLD
ncbi:glycosyltransferase family 39 protein [Streptomyces glaucescens]|uniref:Glycosyl transferase n=1 Tax=Streptomyces glaucescens TaxID=1907 RepID=A0A089WXU8_STRGA|nr:glycosyltransferase family 39 protein [Streptomyces glaucescens]AIR96247.1 glycosyl transferase [Streptomyces glaucescens]